jgi:hypothetical protein
MLMDEDRMDEHAPRKRTTRFTRAARTKRMLERLRAGDGYEDIARDEGLSESRVRKIVAEHLKRREAVEEGTHANVQLDRLSFAMRVASEALAKGDVKAIAPLIKVIDRLDHYQARASEAAPRRRRTEADQVVLNEFVRRIRRDYAHELARSRAGQPAEAPPPAQPDATLAADAPPAVEPQLDPPPAPAAVEPPAAPAPIAPPEAYFSFFRP